MGERLFVYGTLMPGHLRWSMLSPWSVHEAEVGVPGVLYDTGNGWPAATFDAEAASTVPGWVVDLADGAPPELWAVLDEMEGIGSPPDPATDPYVRVRVTLPDRTEAWAYHATRIPAAWRAIDAWTTQAEA